MIRYFLLVLLIVCEGKTYAQTIKVGSKHFTESYILGEMIALLLEDSGFRVERNLGLGGTQVSFAALQGGDIDVYPEYTGTISLEILKDNRLTSIKALSMQVSKEFQLGMTQSYGFNNTYAIVVSPRLKRKFDLQKISDLRKYPKLRMGFGHEFLERADGWGNLSRIYRLSHQPVGLEHGLAYNAMMEGRIDVMDAYSTDGEIAHFGLSLLKDDRDFFPDYLAVSLYRLDLPEKAQACLKKLEGVIDDNTMQVLNGQALFNKLSYYEIAYRFLVKHKLIREFSIQPKDNEWKDILKHVGDHIMLTFISLFMAIAIAIPLGVFIFKTGDFTNGLLYVAGILQTIPSIALLALMIPFFGIGVFPALVALFLYALLPILRNTLSGLTGIDSTHILVAKGIGLTGRQMFWHIELPLALPAILTGIRTAAVINIGTATLAAFIGSGGLGEYIVIGLALNDTSIILKGAIPAALLAIAIELLFELLERVAVPSHLRRKLLN